MCLLVDATTGIGRVVIDNHLVDLPVAFSWCEDDGPCLLEHGYQIRHDNGLGEQVFTASEKWWTLPFPHFILDVVIATMTGPDGEMAVLKSSGYLIG